MIKVKVVYGGVLAELVGIQYEELHVREEEPLEELLRIIQERHTKVKEWLDRIPLIHVLVNGKEVDSKTYRLRDGDEIDIYPSLYEGG